MEFKIQFCLSLKTSGISDGSEVATPFSFLYFFMLDEVQLLLDIVDLLADHSLFLFLKICSEIILKVGFLAVSYFSCYSIPEYSINFQLFLDLPFSFS